MLPPAPPFPASTRFLSRRLRLGAAGLLAAALPALGADGDFLGSGVTAFDLGGALTDIGGAVAVQPDGKVVVAGTVATGAASRTLALARYLPDGSLDPTFGVGGKSVDPFDEANNLAGVALHLLPDGRLLVACIFDFGTADRDFYVGRLLAGGAADLSFGGEGFGARLVAFDLGGDLTDTLAAMTVDRSGRILLAGAVDVSATDVDFGIVRLTPEGELDPDFSGDGRATVDLSFGDVDRGLAIASGTQGIVVAGAAWSAWGGGHFDIAVARLLGDGSPDPAFGAGGTTVLGQAAGGTNDDFAWAVGVWPDGEVVVAGEVATGTDASMWHASRFDSGGNYLGGVSGAFCGYEPPCAANPLDAARALQLEGDGKVLVAGFGLGPAGNRDFGVARLGRDLTPDFSFGGGDGVATHGFDRGPGARSDFGTATVFDHDGRIVVAGATEWNGLDTDFAWARFDSSYIFADDFEWPGGTARWSSVTP